MTSRKEWEDVPLFVELDESELEDLDDWSLESAVLGEDAPDNRFDEFVETLDEKLSNDIGYASAKANIDTLARMYIEDKPNYARAEQIIRRYKLLRLINTAVKARARQISNIQAVPGGGENLSLVKVRDEFVDAPVHPDAIVPPSWVVDGTNQGTRRYRLMKRLVRKREGEYYEELIGIGYSPIVITAIMIDIADRSANLALAWKAKGRWCHKVVPRQKTLMPRELIDAIGGDHGFPVSVNNAKDLIEYLVDYEAHNEEVIPLRPMTTQMGWQKEGKLGFVAGKQHVQARPNQTQVHFVGIDEGEDQLARCTGERGTMDGWLQAVKIASNFPAVELALYASLAPPLLTPLRAPNFTVDWSHKTSSGKTTTLSLAASCWGNPDPNGHDSLIASWDMTTVGFERRAAAMSCLPLLVDDTKRARSWRGESVVPSVVYEISNGQGRIRGSLKGTAKTAYWRTVMLSTGEQRIIDFDKSGGTPARVVTLWGSPFGGTSAIIARAIRNLKTGIAENYGHAGPAFVEWLVQNRGDWSTLREEHEDRIVDIEARMLNLACGMNMDMAVISRVATYLATLQLTAECVHEALAMPWELEDPIGELLPAIVPAACAVDRELEALREVVSWACANREKFIRNEKHRKDMEPYGGWLGFWEAADFDSWDRLAFFPTVIRDFLRRNGYEPQSTLRNWLDAGWLDHGDKQRPLTAHVSELSGRPRMICLRRQAVEKYGGLEPPGGQTVLPLVAKPWAEAEDQQDDDEDDEGDLIEMPF